MRLRVIRNRWNPLFFILSLLLTLLAATPASAQSSVKGEIVSVGIGGANGTGGVFRVGSWVPVQVRLQNVSPSPVIAHLAVQSLALNDLDGDRVTSHGMPFTLNVSPEPRTFWTYYWPGPDDRTEIGSRGVSSVLVMEGEKGERVLAEVTTPDRRPGGIGLGRVDDMKGDSSYRSSRFVVVLGKSMAGWNVFSRSWGGAEAVAVAQVTHPANLPDNVKGLDAVDVIVWEADSIKVSDIAPEFQLKAMLQWVRAGGHLIISTGTQWQEFQRAANADLQAALPMNLTSSRQVKWGEISLSADWANRLRQAPHDEKTFEHVVGTLKPNARGHLWPRNQTFANSPLVATGMYGQGAVTLVTFDVTNADFADALKGAERFWASFWIQTAGWMSPTDFKTAAQADAEIKNETMASSPATVQLWQNIPGQVDVTEFTEVRILVAILFLALYWLLAGPVGHLILRAYRVVHWSWWIFGGTVLVATLVAGGVVSLLHVSASEVRHRSFVIGAVNSRDVSVASYYGIYAPASGPVQLAQPAGDGMSYLTPMCFPISGDIKSYADPQSYEIWAESATRIAPIFRHTLKKMQGRWSGQMPGLTGTASFSTDPVHVLSGELVNGSDYDLYNVSIVVYRPLMQYGRDSMTIHEHSTRPGDAYIYQVGQWKKGETLDLSKKAVLDPLNFSRRAELSASANEEDFGARLGHALQMYARARQQGGPRLGSGGTKWNDIENDYQRSLGEAMASSVFRNGEDLLAILFDLRSLDRLSASTRVEVIRGPARLMDSIKLLHATGALVIATSNRDQPAKAPVPLTANGNELPSKGDTTFVWALPVRGEMPSSMIPAPPAATATSSARDGVLPEN